MMKKSMILFGVMILMSCQSADVQPLIEPKHDEYFKAICYHPVSISNSQRAGNLLMKTRFDARGGYLCNSCLYANPR